ncbi:hypothetical protein L2E82_16522 [Cichorium intybus]|uniref:Uncharacterized protein n=1 Tax=Cichorium intybus TaxID=13427 RepID=A0ACB9F548_CICIN|nr:hypothetical protein L2E82_16522 [Cichorium intybus]
MTTYGTIPTSSGGGTNLEYLSRAKARIKSGLGTRRPWKEMFNLGSVDFPHGVADAFSRIRTNLGYFRMNYAIIVLIILFLSLLWQPVSLIVFVVMMVVWLFLYFLRDEPLVIFHRTIDDGVVLVILSVTTIVLLLLTGATMNILSSILIGLAVVVVHAVLRNTHDLSLDDGSAEAGGYLASSSS